MVSVAGFPTLQRMMSARTSPRPCPLANLLTWRRFSTGLAACKKNACREAVLRRQVRRKLDINSFQQFLPFFSFFEVFSSVFPIFIFLFLIYFCLMLRPEVCILLIFCTDRRSSRNIGGQKNVCGDLQNLLQHLRASEISQTELLFENSKCFQFTP